MHARGEAAEHPALVTDMLKPLSMQPSAVTTRLWRAKNRDRQLVLSRRQNEKNKIAGYVYSKARKAKARANGRCIAHNRLAACGLKRCLLCLDLWLSKKYGMSASDFVRIMAHQQGSCGICRRVKPLRVDHDHKAGTVRGLLCNRCNVLVGYLETSEDGILTSISKYLNREKGW